MSIDVTAVLLDQLTLGIALLSPAGRSLFMNSAFRQLVEANDELRVTGGFVSIRDSDDNRQFDAALARPIGSERAIVPVTRRSGRQGLECALVTLSDAVVAVFASDALDNTAQVSKALKSVYGLTEGQSEITEMVVRGFDTSQIASKRSVHVSTVRTLLKRTFQKTGVSRQVDLVRLSLGGVGARVRSNRGGTGLTNGSTSRP
jgi:DNA-binding CsgD family transcriptional regulator